MAGESRPQLEVRDLETILETGEGTIRVVDGTTFHLDRGETLGLVGESGCGKTMTALSIMRLVPPSGRIVGGEVLLDGRNLLNLSEREMRSVRGGKVSMIFQEPMSSLNPVFTVGGQISETIRTHERTSGKTARERAAELLSKVKIPDPRKRLDDYPHQMSGGMRQRSMIAMALACRPDVLIADEPTTALDVTIQARIMELLRELQDDLDMSILLITHNLALVAETADRITVMYASKVVEQSDTMELFSNPLHPYTQGLLASVPILGAADRRKLSVIPGQVPDPLDFPRGCRFHPRCPLTVERCREEEPVLREIVPAHRAACHLADESGVASWPESNRSCG